MLLLLGHYRDLCLLLQALVMRCAIDHSLSQSKFIRELIMNNYNLLYVLALRLCDKV